MRKVVAVTLKAVNYGAAHGALAMAAVNANTDYSKTCMVIDEDVNIHDLNDVWWAYLTRGRADTRAEILKDMPGFYRENGNCQ